MASEMASIPSDGSTKQAAKDRECYTAPLTHLFLELTSLEELSFPTSSSTRIKYTCLAASAHYLAVGSTSGTVYLFSRFASKHRSRISSVPIQVISIKDGPIIKLSISPNEKFLAAASRRGSLAVSTLTSIDQNPVVLFSSDCHVDSDDGQASYITELCWSSDSSKVYAGDTKGRISRTRVTNRNFFRPPSSVIFQTDSEIVQFDLRDDSLLASTLTRCCICDLKTGSCIQVGKRLRNGHFGAVFYSDQRKRKLLNGTGKAGSTSSTDTSGMGELTVIFASRPSGRLWEANKCGLVYSTHQYRDLNTVCRFPVVSYKEDVLSNDVTCDGQIGSISFGRLTLVKCQESSFLMTKTDSSFCLIDPSDSHVLLMSSLNYNDSVCEYAVNGADLFLLSSKTGSLRKLTLFTLEKAVEKLHWRHCYAQAAQVIYASGVLNKSINSGLLWNYEQLEDILNKISSSNYKSHFSPEVISTLHEVLNTARKSIGGERKPQTAVFRLSSGIHRVVRVMENSGYEDDFTFRAPSPLRVRSKSTPNMELAKTKTFGWKRRSLPLKHGTVAEAEDREEQRNKLINEARMLLDAEKTSNQLAHNGSMESLRTLLDCSNTLIMFDQQVTIKDVTKDLEAAKKFLRLIGNKSSAKGQRLRRVTTEQVDFKALFGRRDPLELLEKCVESIPPNVNVNVSRLRMIHRTRRGARIVKGIKPFGKRNKVPDTESCNGETIELPLLNNHNKLEEGEEMLQKSIRGDLASCERFNLNCNGIRKEKGRDLKQSTAENETSLLNKSYVVEKNFVAVRPIEVTWTMNNDDGNDLASMKSSNGMVTLTSERLIHSGEVIVAPTTLMLSETTKLEGGSSLHCHICGLHRLWHHVTTFGQKMSQLRVTVDQFADGGVPASLEQWSKLFEYRACTVAVDDGIVEGQLCDDCSAFFEFSDRLKEKASLVRETVARIERRNMEKKCSGSVVQTTAKALDDDAVYNMFFKDNVRLKKANTGHLNQASVDCHSEGPKERLGLDRNLKKFSWLPAVTISQLLLCMRYCQGFGAVFEFLRNNDSLTSSLTTADWQWLAVMKAYESMRSSDVMPREVVANLLLELQITTIEDVGESSATSFIESCSSGANSSRSLTGSLTVSVDGNCPCCTLPLKMRVTQSDGYITIFRCGHLYHQICLREANLFRCIRCEIERRRRRQQLQQVNSPSAAPCDQRSPAARTRQTKVYLQQLPHP